MYIYIFIFDCCVVHLNFLCVTSNWEPYIYIYISQQTTNIRNGLHEIATNDNKCMQLDQQQNMFHQNNDTPNTQAVKLFFPLHSDMYERSNQIRYIHRSHHPAKLIS